MAQEKASGPDSSVATVSTEDARAPMPARSATPAPSATPARTEILRLQRSAGNRAVLRVIARRRQLARLRVLGPDEVYQDPNIKKVAERYSPSEEQIAALHLLDKDPKNAPGGAWSHISWGDIAGDAAERVCNPTAFDQGSLGTCGLAAILNFDARVDPKGYVGLVQECYTQGKLKGSRLNSKLLGNTPQPGMPVVDWMLMSGMQDKTNDWYDYYGRPEDKREGTTNPDKKWAMKKYAGALEAKIIETPKAEDVLPATRTVNDLLAKHPDDVEVIISVSASVLQNPASDENKRNHAIGLTKPAKITEDASGDPTKGTVEADVFTWAQIKRWSGTVRQFQHMVWAYTVSSRKKGVL